jgi:hypothetical protein
MNLEDAERPADGVDAPQHRDDQGLRRQFGQRAEFARRGSLIQQRISHEAAHEERAGRNVRAHGSERAHLARHPQDGVERRAVGSGESLAKGSTSTSARYASEVAMTEKYSSLYARYVNAWPMRGFECVYSYDQ